MTIRQEEIATQLVKEIKNFLTQKKKEAEKNLINSNLPTSTYNAGNSKLENIIKFTTIALDSLQRNCIIDKTDSIESLLNNISSNR